MHSERELWTSFFFIYLFIYFLLFFYGFGSYKGRLCISLALIIRIGLRAQTSGTVFRDTAFVPGNIPTRSRGHTELLNK
jgi:hypothetical protein